MMKYAAVFLLVCLMFPQTAHCEVFTYQWAYLQAKEHIQPFLDQKKYDEGIKDVHELLKKCPFEEYHLLGMYYQELALFYYHKNEINRAVGYIDKSISLDPDSVSAVLTRAHIDTSRGSAYWAYKRCVEGMNKINMDSPRDALMDCEKMYSPFHPLSAKDILSAYVSDPVAAEIKYRDTLVTIRGKIVLINYEENREPVVIMTALTDPPYMVNFQFYEDEAQKVSALKEGQESSITGIVGAFVEDEFLFIKDCELR